MEGQAINITGIITERGHTHRFYYHDDQIGPLLLYLLRYVRDPKYDFTYVDWLAAVVRVLPA